MSQPIPLVRILGLDSVGATQILYYASMPLVWNAVNVFVEGYAPRSASVRRMMYEGTAIRGPQQIESGVAVLDNMHGGLDSLLPLAFDGQSFQVIRMDPVTRVVEPTGSRRYMFFGSTEQANFDFDTVTFAIRDAAHQLDVAALTVKYLGNNVLPAGIEGSAQLLGKPKPAHFGGQVLNWTPEFVNTSKLIFQVDGVRGFVTGWALSVYDKRAVLTAGANYVSQADMEATAPAAGQYRVWPAGGCFRLGTAPVGRITCDVTNPCTTGTGLPGSVTGLEIHSVMRQIAALQNATYATYSLGAFHSLMAATPDVGMVLDSEITVFNALADLAGGCSAYFRYIQSQFIPEANGGIGFVMGQLCDPAALPYTADRQILYVTESDVLGNGPRRITPPGPDRGLPVWRVNLSYAKNYTVMSETDLAGVAATEIEFASKEYRTVSASDATVKTQWPAAPELNVKTYIVSQADAQAEADRLLALHKVRRDMFVLTITGELARSVPDIPGTTLYPVQVGSRVNLAYPRFGLDAGRLFLLVSFDENFENDTVEITVWG